MAEIIAREAREANVEPIRDLFDRCYGLDYRCYREFYIAQSLGGKLKTVALPVSQLYDVRNANFG